MILTLIALGLLVPEVQGEDVPLHDIILPRQTNFTHWVPVADLLTNTSISIRQSRTNSTTISLRMTKKEVLSLIGKPVTQHLEIKIKSGVMKGDIWHYFRRETIVGDGTTFRLHYYFLSFHSGVVSQIAYGKSVRYRCVAEGTLISTENFSTPVETLKVGDKIWGYDLETKKKALTTIEAIHSSVSDYVIRISDGLMVTPVHPVYANDQWVPAGQLNVGDSLLGENGERIEIVTMKTITGKLMVYDLTVGPPHNFFAGGILVHNKR